MCSALWQKNLLRSLYYKKISEKSKTNGNCYKIKTFMDKSKGKERKVNRQDFTEDFTQFSKLRTKIQLHVINYSFQILFKRKKKLSMLKMWLFRCCPRCIKAQIKDTPSANKNSWSNFMSPRWKKKVEQGKKKRLYNIKLMQCIGTIHVSCYLTYKLFVSLVWILFSFTIWCNHLAKKNWLIELGLEGICVFWKREALSHRTMEYFGRQGMGKQERHTAPKEISKDPKNYWKK